MDKRILIVSIIAVCILAAACIAIFVNNGENDSDCRITFELKDDGTIKATSDGKAIQSGDAIKKGSEVTLVITPDDGFHLDKWVVNGKQLSVTENELFIDKVEKDTDVKVFVTAPEVGFYFADDFEYDNFSSESNYETVVKNICGGLWVRGNGQTMESAFDEACGDAGYTYKLDADGDIKTINDIIDGNIHIWFWDVSNNKWIQKDNNGVVLTFLNTNIEDYPFVAVIHGAAQLGTGNSPTVKTTPSEIKWYCGDDPQIRSGEKVIFYISNNLEYSEVISSRTDASNSLTLLNKGFWISGYASKGQLVSVALEDALKSVGFEYTITAGFIESIGDAPDGNYVQAAWDDKTNTWNQDSWSGNTKVEDIDYMTITHGAWYNGSQIPPCPSETPDDIYWHY